MPTPELTKDDERDELGSRWDFLAAGSRDEGSLGNSKAASDQIFSSLFYNEYIMCIYIYIIYCIYIYVRACYSNHEKLCTLTHAHR